MKTTHCKKLLAGVIRGLETPHLVNEIGSVEFARHCDTDHARHGVEGLSRVRLVFSVDAQGGRLLR